MIRMTREEVQAERERMDARASMSGRIKELEARIKESDAEAIGWIEAVQDANGIMRSDTIQLRRHVVVLENALADARRDHELLTRLVERIGKDFDVHCNETCHEPGGPLYWPYTVEGQREYDAALHSAGVEPPDAVSVGARGAI